MTVVACHQPNFIPWLGFFSKMADVDTFILLDDVQPPNGNSRHNFVNRVQIADRNGPFWITVPVSSSQRSTISEVTVRHDAFEVWKRRTARVFEQTYARSPYTDAYFPQLIDILEMPVLNLVDLNFRIIGWLRGLLGIGTEIRFSSQLGVSSTSSTRLADLTNVVGGSTYVSGSGSVAYLELEPFRMQRLAIRYHSFTTKEYEQRNTRFFCPGLSTLDAVFNIGPERTRQALIEGSRDK